MWFAQQKNLDENLLCRLRQSHCRTPSCSGRSAVGEMQFVTKGNFSSRGLGGGSAGRYLIAQHSPILLTKIAPVFATAARGGAARKCLVGCVLLSACLYFFVLRLLVATTNDRIFGANDCSVRCGCRFRFWGNMCAVISVWPSYSPHIRVPYVCLFSMPNPTFISKVPRPLSCRYDNPYGFLIDFFLFFCGRSLIDMIHHAFVLIWW